MQIPIISRNEPDIICWKLARSGMCYAYKVLVVHEATSHSPSNVHVQVLQILKHVWENKTMQPWVKSTDFCSEITETHPRGIVSRVNSIISKVDETYSRCSNLEDENHIFFHCSFAKVVWFASHLSDLEPMPCLHRTMDYTFKLLLLYSKGPHMLPYV